MAGIEILARSIFHKGIDAGLGKFGDELFSAKHREYLPVHLQAVGRHHLGSGYVPVLRRRRARAGNEDQSRQPLGGVWLSSLPWAILLAIAASVTVEIRSFSTDELRYSFEFEWTCRRRRREFPGERPHFRFGRRGARNKSRGDQAPGSGT